MELHEGAAVEVFSRSARAWMCGRVIDMSAKMVTVEYGVRGHARQKQMRKDSQYLRPMAPASESDGDASDNSQEGANTLAQTKQGRPGLQKQTLAAGERDSGMSARCPSESDGEEHDMDAHAAEEKLPPRHGYAAEPTHERMSVHPRESCFKNGEYIPGRTGNTHHRNVLAEKLYKRHPSVLERIEHHEASEIWKQERLLHFGDKLTDGFTARFSKELIYVDQTCDCKLREFLAYCRGVTKFFDDSEQFQMAQALSIAVCDALGGHACAELKLRMGRLVQESGKQRHEPMPIGDTFCGGHIFGQACAPGAGLCRHRSILFKYVCDELEICDCALVDGMLPPSLMLQSSSVQQKARPNGQGFDHMWNIVRISGENYITDALNLPGQLLNAEGLQGLPVQFCRIKGRSGLSLWQGTRREC
eukprot:TRINITY_DN35887_c0_g1_i1.p1 TRINITY_DN35887_c0_g1~~TRINITY_DN35887_c0_g1_i1.p1  ORF type:complete len:418 (+),score=78.52 TRINITY_DN35887_c0_g1_i1:57-1310(+)